jgi:hypothetical protein
MTITEYGLQVSQPQILVKPHLTVSPVAGVGADFDSNSTGGAATSGAQNAVDASYGPGTATVQLPIYFLPGIHKWSSKVTLAASASANARLFGAGAENTIIQLQPGGPSDALLQWFKGPYFINVQDLSMDANNQTINSLIDLGTRLAGATTAYGRLAFIEQFGPNLNNANVTYGIEATNVAGLHYIGVRGGAIHMDQPGGDYHVYGGGYQTVVIDGAQQVFFDGSIVGQSITDNFNTEHEIILTKVYFNGYNGLDFIMNGTAPAWIIDAGGLWANKTLTASGGFFGGTNPTLAYLIGRGSRFDLAGGAATPQPACATNGFYIDVEGLRIGTQQTGQQFFTNGSPGSLAMSTTLDQACSSGGTLCVQFNDTKQTSTKRGMWVIGSINNTGTTTDTVTVTVTGTLDGGAAFSYNPITLESGAKLSALALPASTSFSWSLFLPVAVGNTQVTCIGAATTLVNCKLTEKI